MIQIPSKYLPKLRFSDLPLKDRTAYHGTNSVFLEGIKLEGLWISRHPLIEEARRQILKIGKKVHAEAVRNYRLKRKYGTLEHGSFLGDIQFLCLMFSKGSKMYSRPCLADSKGLAVDYATSSPEIVDQQILGYAPSVFSRLPGLFGSLFEKEAREFLQLSSEIKGVFLEGKPVVLTYEIPSLDYIAGFEKRQSETDYQAIAEAYRTSNRIGKPFLFYFSELDAIRLAKPLPPHYILEVDVLDKPMEYQFVK